MICSNNVAAEGENVNARFQDLYHGIVYVCDRTHIELTLEEVDYGNRYLTYFRIFNLMAEFLLSAEISHQKLYQSQFEVWETDDQERPIKHRANGRFYVTDQGKPPVDQAAAPVGSA